MELTETAAMCRREANRHLAKLLPEGMPARCMRCGKEKVLVEPREAGA